LRPLIYIGSLRRTGSTLLSEALTQPPHSFVLVEPAIAENHLGLGDTDAKALHEHGIDLGNLPRSISRGGRVRRLLHVDGCYALRRFRDEVIPLLERRFAQVGVKEIRHRHWRRYHDVFPDMRVVLLSRDPRDVFISLAYRVRKGRGSWRGPLTPERVAADLHEEFMNQRAMAEELDCHVVRYEDLCTDPTRIDAIRTFVGCPTNVSGQVGRFLSSNAHRLDEHALHGGTVTDQRVHRWRKEPDRALVEDAKRTFALMGEYCAFFGYDEDCP
jgi:hypothetical protein